MEIKLSNVTKRYHKGMRNALDIEDFAFESGKIYGIVGQNGSGKTTLFKSLTTIIDSFGEITYDGVNVHEDTTPLSKVGIVLDDLTLYRNWTGRQNIEFFMTLKHSMDISRVDELAEKLSIKGDLDSKVGSYSLGMTKKLILLIALIDDVQVLILDEPFRGVDRQSTDALTKFIKEEFMSSDKIVLISSHVANDIESMADTFVKLDKGKIVESGKLTLTNYKVKTDQVEEFKTLLKKKDVPYENNEQTFILRGIEDDDWNKLLKAAMTAKISFSNINKISEVEEVLN
ncbi:MAG: ABC transporter ATP-binding protein [Lactobacillaceae bacterium]|jgi:ABC-2 type transport system ATP-binding protein|nr:ABC transporter ATP-binding protein [Lactobacillaceae bacterium]